MLNRELEFRISPEATLTLKNRQAPPSFPKQNIRLYYTLGSSIDSYLQEAVRFSLSALARFHNVVTTRPSSGTENLLSRTRLRI